MGHLNMLKAEIHDLEDQLNDFDLQLRTAALEKLVALAEAGQIEPCPPAEVANMHCHTFFSFNAYGHSPSSLAWLARKNGYRLMGIVDFDVLDGVDEFLNACDKAGVRGSAGIETRLHLPQFADREINSPGEPGIYYAMGIGFTRSSVPQEVGPILRDLRERAAHRNRLILARVNDYLHPLALDYEQDVLPLTPAGTATERHMVFAYVRKAEDTLGDVNCFWADKLQLSVDRVSALRSDPAGFQNVVRGKLMKRGGVGYITPAPETFPTLAEFHQLIAACQALPCATWLDGTSAGEQAMEELLALLVEQGAAALNVIPDRNWNIGDPALKQVKLNNLYEVVRLAQELELPLHIGTEMNSAGQKLIDDFDAPELAPVREAFLEGAYFIYGHTVLQRALGLGYASEWARSHLPGRGERNRFYTQIGIRIPPGKASLERLGRLSSAMSPTELLAQL